MIRIILCEGETDATLLGYYLNKMAGWTYNKKPKYLQLRFSPQDNKCFLPYRNENGDELFICGVGGKDGFKNFLNEYLYEVIYTSHKEEKQFKIAVITDRDKTDIKEIEDDVVEQMSRIGCDVVNRTWTNNVFLNSFQQECQIEFLLVVIPQEKEGALENLLMDSLAENGYDANIVTKSKHFVSDSIIEIERYVSSERLKVKAQLGVVLSIMNPDRVFSLFDEYIKAIPWEKYQILNECFSELIVI